MRKKLTLLGLLAFVCFTGQAQQFTWAKNFGINGSFAANAVTSDNQGNTYFTGSFGSQPGDQDPSQGTFTLANNGGGDMYVMKLNSEGKIQWAHSFGAGWADNGFAIQTDADGNVYVAGAFAGTVDFDPGPGTFTINAPQYQSIYLHDAFILKLDKDGNFLFAGSISGERDDYIHDMEIHDNKIYVTGLTGINTDFDLSSGTHLVAGSEDRHAFAAAYDMSGNLQWVSMVDGESAATELSVDPAGNVYVTGNFFVTGDFDPGAGVHTMTSAGGDDIFVWKLDASGNLVWSRALGGSDHDYGHALVATSANVFVTGYYQGTADLDPGPGISINMATPNHDPRDAGEDIFILNLTASGDFVWAHSIGGSGYDHGDAVEIDQDGYIYVGGSFYGLVDFDPTYGEARLQAQFADIFIMKLKVNGSVEWVGQMGGSQSLDNISDIHADIDNQIYLAGRFMGTADLDPTEGVHQIASAGVTNGYIVKLNGDVHLLISALSENQAASFSLFPNPAREHATLQAGQDLIQKVSVYNSLGNLNATITAPGSTTTLNLGGLAKGIYFVVVESGRGTVSQKLVVE